jgi:hypothetical protein
MEEKIKIRCPACTRVFRESANKIRAGAQLNCLNCNRLITFNRDTEDPFIRRALKAAKESREAQQAAILETAYSRTNPNNSPA